MVKVAAYLDRILEMRNNIQKAKNTSRLHIMNSLVYTAAQPALQHVQSTWRQSQEGPRASEDGHGIRSSMINEVCMFQSSCVYKYVSSVHVHGKKACMCIKKDSIYIY